MKKSYPIAILLALCMLLTLLGGCGSQNDAASAVSEPSAVSAVEAPPEEPALEEAPAPEPVSVEESGSVLEPEPELLPEITYPLCEEPETLSLYCTACNFMGPLSSVSMEWSDFD